jgi:hypothetical protein
MRTLLAVLGILAAGAANGQTPLKLERLPEEQRPKPGVN